MRDFLTFVAMCCFFVAAWGIIKPFKGYSRKQFALATFVSLVVAMIAVPPQTPEQIAAKEAQTKKEEADKVASGQDEIIKKARPGIDAVTTYTRADFKDTFAKVGASSFKRLTELEPGAMYVAAESSKCDMISNGAVSLNMSRKDKPMWYVDCQNGNRFMVDATQAEAALKRFQSKTLALNDLEQSCTDRTVAVCSSSKAQKAANETEVVTFCDLTVKDALVGDSSMDWGWNYAMGDGDTIQVIRNFKAENAFGAKLKHRYICEFNAETKRIEKLSIEGPFGRQKII